MEHYRGDSPVADIAYLARSDHRVPTLVALTERPRSRSELCELTGVSSSTMRRTLDTFDDRLWVRKEGYQYTATRLGEVVASGMEDLLERVEIERTLRSVWHWLPDAISEFPFETWSELTVTVAEPDAPYRPVGRFESLLRESTTVRFLRPEVALMDLCFDVLHQLIQEGVDVTLIDRPECHAYFLSTYPNRSSEMMRRENFTVLEHDDLPQYGLGLLDERVTISCYERDSGTVHAVIDTDAAPVREWAASVYETYRSGARSVEQQNRVE
ncbi:helix-turn-helix transcriptional regulator [Halorussus amylolyticus]|uniref:helix-turn-helix transcriptional regulator n=1 Tax=Halorussus amylolyticus TaxID=1126242 RepID=UPI00192FA24B|nr:MarR family transcriptional regulator [Halorussus amylolyticus]